MDTHNYNQERERLEARGWALQKSLFSPRVLFFGERELSRRFQATAVEMQRKGIESAKAAIWSVQCCA